MEEKTVQERVIKVLSERLGIDAATITSESPLSGSPMNINWADVVERVEFVLDLENEFGLEYIDDETNGSWQTIADIIAYFESVAHS